MLLPLRPCSDPHPSVDGMATGPKAASRTPPRPRHVLYEQAAKHNTMASPRSKAAEALAEDIVSGGARRESHVSVVVVVVLAVVSDVVLAVVSARAALVELVELSSEDSTSSHHVVPVCAWHISRVMS